MKPISEKRRKSIIKWVALAIAGVMFFSVILSAILGVLM